jgi:hypothetical protein
LLALNKIQNASLPLGEHPGIIVQSKRGRKFK